MAHFYLSDDLTGTAVGSEVTVSGSEARHAVTVGRLRVGETTTVGNGAGLVVSGTVTNAEPAEFSIRVEAVRTEPESRPAVWLAQALAKGDRDELAIQAATELGVDAVIPWAAARSIVRWEGPKLQKHHDRWAAILREAGKQSMRARLPRLLPLVNTAKLVALAADLQTVVLEPLAELPLTGLPTDGRDILLIVGPEGGIAPAERERFVAAGATEYKLGTTVLRTSTAGPAALAVVNSRLGRW
ncbi:MULTISPECIES: 16S rRNA (uracil(1498)-N(3))-methyltransferase [unclassified Cryobacterium]|uniref:16S rRNA (uracil(1498)-N(3))-methyltransferase n=1 Tax=unclassified Cryobacterium TaxID=2649013 RepID=UPI0014454B20